MSMERDKNREIIRKIRSEMAKAKQLWIEEWCTEDDLHSNKKDVPASESPHILQTRQQGKLSR